MPVPLGPEDSHGVAAQWGLCLWSIPWREPPVISCTHLHFGVCEYLYKKRDNRYTEKRTGKYKNNKIVKLNMYLILSEYSVMGKKKECKIDGIKKYLCIGENVQPCGDFRMLLRILHYKCGYRQHFTSFLISVFISSTFQVYSKVFATELMWK